MAGNPDSPSVLRTELAEALDRSLLTSIQSLSSLRLAVRAYTIHEKDLGVSLDKIVLQARAILSDVEDDRGDRLHNEPVRDGALAREVESWSRRDFANDC